MEKFNKFFDKYALKTLIGLAIAFPTVMIYELLKRYVFKIGMSDEYYISDSDELMMTGYKMADVIVSNITSYIILISGILVLYYTLTKPVSRHIKIIGLIIFAALTILSSAPKDAVKNSLKARYLAIETSVAASKEVKAILDEIKKENPDVNLMKYKNQVKRISYIGFNKSSKEKFEKTIQSGDK